MALYRKIGGPFGSLVHAGIVLPWVLSDLLVTDNNWRSLLAPAKRASKSCFDRPAQIHVGPFTQAG